VTSTSGAAGNLLQPGDHIDTEVFFTTGSAATGQSVQYGANTSCGGKSITEDVTGIVIN
jgi:hypothetical protein